MDTPKIKYPPKGELVSLIKLLKHNIQDSFRAFEEDELPGIQLTVGFDGIKEWSFQTGDNCYSGPAYYYPHWAVVGIYRQSNSKELADDILNQLAELVEQ